MNSEKYEIKHWDWTKVETSKMITVLNNIRQNNPALRISETFLSVDNDYLLFYIKATYDQSNIIAVIVN